MKPNLTGYRFLEPLGQGAHGEVWHACQVELGRDCAVKCMPQERLSTTGIDRLRREACAMANLSKHPNRAEVYDFRTENDSAFLIMEYVDGGPLSQRIPIAWDQAVLFAFQVASGLLDMHSSGVAHRDIKPSNVLWSRRTNEAVLTDFGLAGHVEGVCEIGGTPGYMAPEALVGRPLLKSDVFSLAATIFHLISGSPPFASDQTQNLIQASARQAMILPPMDSIPRPVRDVLCAGLEPDPSVRPTVNEFNTSLGHAYSQVLAEDLFEHVRDMSCTVSLRVSVFLQSRTEPNPTPLADFQAPQDCRSSAFPAINARTGDQLLLDISADVGGYLTLLNFGSSGRLQVAALKRQGSTGLVRPGQRYRQSLCLKGVPGTDRFAIIWSRKPVDSDIEAWRKWLASSHDAREFPLEPNRDVELMGCPEIASPRDSFAWIVFAVSHSP